MMTIFRNYLYCMNDNGNILVFIIGSNNHIDYTNQHRIDIPKIKSIAVNSLYFGIIFADLESKYYKKIDKNNTLSSGVLLFKKDNDKIDVSKYDKLLNILNNFKLPNSLSLNEDYAFVCDKELKAVFKININNGQLIEKITFDKGIPSYCSINHNYILISDTLNHKLCLFDINNLKNNISNQQLDNYDGNEGPHNVYLTNNNHIIYKYYKDSQLVVTDVNFSDNILFNDLDFKVDSFSFCSFYDKPFLITCENDSNKNSKLSVFILI